MSLLFSIPSFPRARFKWALTVWKSICFTLAKQQRGETGGGDREEGPQEGGGAQVRCVCKWGGGLLEHLESCVSGTLLPIRPSMCHSHSTVMPLWPLRCPPPPAAVAACVSVCTCVCVRRPVLVTKLLVYLSLSLTSGNIILLGSNKELRLEEGEGPRGDHSQLLPLVIILCKQPLVQSRQLHWVKLPEIRKTFVFW